MPPLTDAQLQAFINKYPKQLLAALEEQDKIDAEKSLYQFFKDAWPNIETAEFVPGWHLEAIAEHLEAVTKGDINRLIINVPPRSSKTTLASIVWPAWTWAQPNRGPLSGPQVKFLCASYAQLLSHEHSLKCRRLLESNWFSKAWGKSVNIRADQAAKSHYDLTAGGERIATSVGATLTGRGGDCFPAGTLVATTIGDVPIEVIAKEPHKYTVYSYNEQLREVSKSCIIASRKIRRRGLYEVSTVGGNSFRCTADHPIYVEGRGFVRASHLAIGDRLLVASARERNGNRPRLQQMRERSAKAIVRFTENIKERTQRYLLQFALLNDASCSEGAQAMCGLRAVEKESRLSLLLAAMRHASERAPQEGDRSFLQDVRRFLQKASSQSDILLSRLCEQISFQANGWGGQLQFQTSGEAFQSIPKDAGINRTARPLRLRSMWQKTRGKDDREWTNQVQPSLSSHQREYERQFTGELDNALHSVPSQAPRWHFDYIASVTPYSEEEHDVYDIQVERDHNFFANGVLVHNCIIIDDPHQVAEGESDLIRGGVLTWYSEALSTRLNNFKTGAIVVIMQRVHEEDLTGHILANETGWEHLMIPAQYDSARRCVTGIGWEDPRTEDGESFCPGRFNAADLKKLASTLGPYAYAGQYQQIPVPRGGGIVKSDWWQLYDPPMKDGAKLEFPPFEYVVASLDSAYTEKEENDYSALTVWGIWRNEHNRPKVMLMDGWQKRLELHGKTPTANLRESAKQEYWGLVEWVAHTCKKWKVDKLLIEGKASGLTVHQELRRLYSSELWMIEVIQPKGDKVARMHSVVPLFTQNVIYAPDRAYANLVIDEVSKFPRGSHDDLADTVSQALSWLRKVGWAIRNEEYTEDRYISRDPRNWWTKPGGNSQPIYDV